MLDQGLGSAAKSALIALAVVACASGNANSADGSRALNILSPADMNAWCRSARSTCEDYRDAPVALVARLDERLTPLLEARRVNFLAARVQRYLRQYWAVLRNGQLFIIGNFVCRSNVADPTRTPVVLDPAGMCVITAVVPADAPESAQFSYRW
jgi:hypothetical protein